MKTCINCNSEIPVYKNYCSFECNIAYARRLSGPIFQPNGLPITTIRFDGALLENPDADHKDYKFPLVACYAEPIPDGDDRNIDYPDETHALIYTDGSIAITIYETCYSMWQVSTGKSLGGFNERNEYCLTPESQIKLQEYAKKIREERIAYKGIQ